MLVMELQDGFEIPTDELKEGLQTSLNQVQSLTSLVEDMLDISRIQMGKFNFAYAAMDLGELVRSVVESSLPQLERARITPTLHIEKGVQGLWDRERLRQVVSNLLSNCIKYASGAPIDVRVESLGDAGVRLSIQDQGPGITTEQQGLIFERFSRATSKNISGLGLGLFVVKTIVDAHGGSVWVESEVGKGARFIVNLPGQSKT
jgi:signal transduction histidine kinase